jgi:hypothetical protein
MQIISGVGVQAGLEFNPNIPDRPPPMYTQKDVSIQVDVLTDVNATYTIYRLREYDDGRLIVWSYREGSVGLSYCVREMLPDGMFRYLYEDDDLPTEDCLDLQAELQSTAAAFITTFIASAAFVAASS